MLRRFFFPSLVAAVAAVSATAIQADSEIASAAFEHHTPQAVIEFWRAAGPNEWFAKRPEFDRAFRTRFLALHEAAARGDLADWQSEAEGALALVILLDQFPRNAFRGTAHMYATDHMARAVATQAIGAGHDRQFAAELSQFFILPFSHSEARSDQERAVELARAIGPVVLGHAEHHRDIIRRFGRFPHRNPILGRDMRPEEQAYLDEGGYRG